MAQSKTKVFHLEMEGEHYYFGSPKAMFDIMGEEKMGMKYQSFHSNISLKPGDVYTNRRNGYIIRVGYLGQAKTNRSNRWQEIINEGIASALQAQAQQQEEQEVTVVEQTVAEPVVETVAEPAVETVAEPAVEQPVRKPASRSKKKNNDIPEQLTLF